MTADSTAIGFTIADVFTCKKSKSPDKNIANNEGRKHNKLFINLKTGAYSMKYKHRKSAIIVPRKQKLDIDGASQTNFESLGIKEGSGIVSIPTGAGILIYFEGNLNGAFNLHDFNERVYCAAGRAMTSYPTVAFSYLSKEDYESLFFEVGIVEVMDDDKFNIIYTNRIAAESWAERYKQ